MARKREAKQEEVMLIPFLDILCSLIGILVLIVVVVSVAQMTKMNGRTKADVELAVKYQQMLLDRTALEQAVRVLRAKEAEGEAEAEKRSREQAEKQKRLVELRKRLALVSSASANKEQSARLQKAIEELLVQSEAAGKAAPPLQKEIEELQKLLAERTPDKKPRFALARPYGSGSKNKQPLFFVEANGAGIVIHTGKGEQLRVTRESVGVDPGYNAFLETVRGTANPALIFLVRGDGWETYLRAAGWAEQAFNLNTGKMPLPGDGVVDLSLFEKP